jgi:hypothetical protein
MHALLSFLPIPVTAVSLLFILINSKLLALVALSSVRELHVYIGLQLGHCWVISITDTIKFVVMVPLLLDFSAGTAVVCLLCYCFMHNSAGTG